MRRHLRGLPGRSRCALDANSAVLVGHGKIMPPLSALFRRVVRLLPDGRPFKIGAIYQFIYKAANPPVAGIGFAATRDIVSFARYATADDAGTPNR